MRNLSVLAVVTNRLRSFNTVINDIKQRATHYQMQRRSLQKSAFIPRWESVGCTAQWSVSMTSSNANNSQCNFHNQLLDSSIMKGVSDMFVCQLVKTVWHCFRFIWCLLWTMPTHGVTTLTTFKHLDVEWCICSQHLKS